MRENLKKKIEDMLGLGIIRESNSSFAFPIVIMKKKDGSDRICVDYLKLNKLTEADTEPMTTAEDLFDRLGKTKYYFKMDLSKGYLQVPMIFLECVWIEKFGGNVGSRNGEDFSRNEQS